MTAQTERDFSIHPVEHFYEIREGGELKAALYKTFHPTLPFEIFMKVGEKQAKRFRTTGEAAEFVRENC